MRSSLALVAALSSVAAASLLDIRQFGNIPACAQSCVTGNFQGCNLLDIPCICGKETLIAELSCCVSQRCSAEDQAATIKFAVQLCSASGITVPTSAGCTGAAAPSTAPPSSAPSSGPSSSAAPSATSGSPSANTAQSSTTPSPAQSSSSSGSPSSSAPPAAKSNVAAVQNVGSAMGVCAAIAGMIFAL